MVTAATSWVAYDRVRRAVGSELERRLSRVAATGASQIAPRVVEEIKGEESVAYGTVYLQLVTLQSATGLDDALLIDSNRTVLVSARAPDDLEGLPSPLDSLAGPALRQALAGRTAVSSVYARGSHLLRASFAPVRDSTGAVAGVVAIEAEASYVPVLSGLARTLTLIALVSVVAIALLAFLMIRAVWSAERLERRLSRAENLAAMGRLTATLAHEIKNPLAIIRGSADRLKKLEPEAQRMADFVIEESDRLSKTVARYLQFARGHDEAPESGDALGALDQTLDLLEDELRARHVQLERPAKAARPAPVALDNESLKQVYLNLILNAVEAMSEGGRLRIAVSEHHGRIEVTIADQGPGIPPEMLKRLGSPFYTTKAKGTGLGLFLIRRLVQTAGGELKIQSEVGHGTTCLLRLPRRKG